MVFLTSEEGIWSFIHSISSSSTWLQKWASVGTKQTTTLPKKSLLLNNLLSSSETPSNFFLYTESESKSFFWSFLRSTKEEMAISLMKNTSRGWSFIWLLRSIEERNTTLLRMMTQFQQDHFSMRKKSLMFCQTLLQTENPSRYSSIFPIITFHEKFAKESMIYWCLLTRTATFRLTKWK